MDKASDVAASGRLRPSASGALWALVLGAVFGLLGYASVELTIGTGRLAAFWIGNALAIGTLLGRPTSFKTSVLISCCLANVLANLAAGDTALFATGLAIVNLLEITASLFLLERFVVRRQPFATLRQFVQFAFVGMLAPIATGLVASALFATAQLSDFTLTYLQWLAAHSLPIPIFGSMVLIVRQELADRRPFDHAAWRAWALVLMAVMVAVPAVFAQDNFPFLFLVMPVVVLAAFLTGRLGTAIVVAIFACAASLATLLGHGPIALVHGDTRDKIIALQAFLATCLAIGLPIAVDLDGRARIRAELRENRDFIGSILDGIGDMVFKVDADWRLTFTNPNWDRLTGLLPGTVLEWSRIARYVDGDGFDLSRLRRRMETRRSLDEKLVVQIPDSHGKLHQLEVRIVPQFDEHGTFLGAIGTGSDVSELIARTDALAKSEARFRRLAEAAPVGVFQADAGGTLTYVNRFWLDRYGLDAETMLGDRWLKELPRAAPSGGGAAVAGSSEAGEIRRRVVSFRDGNGDELWCETVVTAESDVDGAIVGFVGVLHDITEQRMATRLLKEREEQLAVLADNATDAVLRLDLAGVCKYASPSSQQVFGINHRHMVGNLFLAGFHEEDRDLVMNAFAALASGRTDKVRIAFRSESLTVQGTYNWLEANCGLVRNADSGLPSEIIASLRNVNETKRLEAALLEAKERAEAAAEAKSVFLANMSHEI